MAIALATETLDVPFEVRPLAGSFGGEVDGFDRGGFRAAAALKPSYRRFAVMVWSYSMDSP